MPKKKGLLHRIFGKVITIMIVPHNENRMFQFRIPILIALGLFGAFITLVTTSVLLIQNDIDYKQSKAAAKEAVLEAKEKVVIINEEYNRIQLRVQKFKEEEKKLREMVGLKNKKALVENGGLGGPTKSDQNLLDSILGDDAGKEDIKKSLRNLQTEIDEQMESFDEVKKYVSTLSSIWAASPKGMPVLGYVTSKFGLRKAVFDTTDSLGDGDKKDYHTGVDIANRVGTTIRVTAPGKVVFTGKLGGYGLLVIVDHGYGFSTRYGHCSKILVKKDDKVKAGDALALIGMTGNTTGPHVHYEIRRYGNTVDPASVDRDFYTRR